MNTKFCVTISIILVSHISLFSQNKINGLGPIQLSMTYNQVLDSLKLTEREFINPNVDPVSYSEISEPKKNYILIYDPKKTSSVISYYERCLYAKKLVISEIDITNLQFLLKNVSLIFYRDTLVEIKIQSPSSELLDAIKTKYGSGSLNVAKKKVTCTYGLGEFTKTETFFTRTWNGKPGIIAKYILADVLNSDCEKYFYSYITISIVKKVNQVAECQAKQIKKDNEAERNAKLKELKNF